jgi:hypothetical protein
MAGAHLVVSFAPFIGFDEPNGFGQFNKTLFLQFLSASLYSLTLYIGLLIAIHAIKYLFNVEFSDQIEMDLAIVIFTFFHTVFFLNKIPDDLHNLDQQTDYPNGLKIFTQYVLLPLEVVYLIILYAYTGKILFQWKLPEGSGDDKQTKSKEWRLQSENKGSTISLYRNNRKVMDLEIAKKTDDLAKEFGNQSMDVPQSKLIFSYASEEDQIRVVVRSIAKSGDTYFVRGILLYK